MKKHSNVEILPSLSKEQDFLEKSKITAEQDVKKALELASTLRGKSYFLPNKKGFILRGKDYAK